MNQKGFISPLLVIVLFLLLLVFVPIPTYQSEQTLCKMGENCPQPGWHLGPSIFNYLSSSLISTRSVSIPVSPNSDFGTLSPTHTATPDPTADWKTYTLNSVSFKAPPELAQTRVSEKDLVLENSDPKAVLSTLIINSEWQVSVPSCTSANACYERDLGVAKGAQTANKENTYELTSSIVSGKMISGIRLDTPSETGSGTNMGGYSDFDYYMDNGKNVVQLSFHVLGNTTIAMQQKPLIDQILSTFQFTEASPSASATPSTSPTVIPL